MKKRLTNYCTQALLVIFVMLCSFSAIAQEKKTIKGTISDETGELLPGVNIVVKGTTVGTVSDISGSYTFELPENSDVVIFSFIGYLTQEVTVGNQTIINVTLQTDVEQLEEVVVIGYGSIEKKDVTGAMSSLTAKNFNQGIVTNPMEMMQGRATGVQITPSSGEPGAAVSVKIRGTGSVRGGNDPLYVIDGVPVGGGSTSSGGTAAGDLGGTQAKNPLNFLNPADIESIDILKDASATAIYGSRGSNGVVLITTKKGKSGEAQVSYSGYASISQNRKKIDLLSGQDWRKARQQLASATQSVGYLDYDYGNNTDWQDEIFRTAFSQNHNVSVSGGSAKGSYRASVGYMDQQGIIGNSGMKRLTARINLTQSLIQDRLKLGVNLTSSNVRDRNAPIGDGGGIGGDVIKNALSANPTWPVYDTKNEDQVDGKYFQFSSTERNPVAMIDLIDDRSVTDRVLGNVTADFKILDGLNFNVNLGVDRSSSNRSINISQDLSFMPNGYAEIGYTETQSAIMENFLKYAKTIGDHDFSIMAGYSYQRFDNSGHSMVAQGYVSREILFTNNIGSTNGAIEDQAYSYARVSELQSQFVRANYNFQNKYLVTASVRRDGSSRFGSDKRYGLFKSAALGWRISEEGFLKGNMILNNLKLRVGYGETGNQEIPDYLFLALYRATSADGGITTVQTQNSTIQWETTKQINIGIDFGILDDRITGTLDYFNRSTTDLIFNKRNPSPAFVERGWYNLDGVLNNKGIEASVNVNWLNSTDWDWSSTINFTRIRNVMRDFPESYVPSGRLNGPGLTGVDAQRLANGQASQSFYLRTFTGYDSEGFSTYANEGELTYVGNPYPKYQITLSNRVAYKGIDLSFFIDMQQGNLVYNNTANALFTKAALGQAKNITYNELAAPRSLDDSALPSTKYLEDASFIRLSTVTLGYNIPTKSKWFSSPRVYVTGQNLMVLTDYSGFDPEVSTNKAVNGVPSAGIDYTSYPRPRTFLLGFNVNF